MQRIIQQAGIVCCSDGLAKNQQEQVHNLRDALRQMNISVIMSPYLYQGIGTAKQKAQALMALYGNDDIHDVFDISGGDLANELLPYLDYKRIADSGKTFWGYSDLTSILNGIYSKTGNPGVLYQIRNLIGVCGQEQQEKFYQMLQRKGDDLFRFDYHFIQGTEMEGIVIGGNIRCLLKLAGTEYFPDCHDRILLLESLSGDMSRITAYFSQLQQMGVFDRCVGILLGTFTQLEQENGIDAAPILLQRFVRRDLPIAKTKQIGHGADSKAIMIGRSMCLSVQK
jgi:muramoyltetrapeptide carboxypeptidase